MHQSYLIHHRVLIKEEDFFIKKGVIAEKIVLLPVILKSSLFTT